MVSYYFLEIRKIQILNSTTTISFSCVIAPSALHRLRNSEHRELATVRAAKITSELSDEPKTNEVVNYWFNLGMKAFEDEGYKPNKIVSCFPSNIELDGRSSSVRSSQTLLSKYCCDCMIDSTSSSGTTVGLFDNGSIRIDDILRGTITQYDVLRILPYRNNLFALSVPGEILAKVLINGALLKGLFLIVKLKHVIKEKPG